MTADTLRIFPEMEAAIRKLPHGGMLASKIWAGYISKAASFKISLINSNHDDKILTLDKHSELLFILICFVVFRDCGKTDFLEVAIHIALGLFHV
jgi:hypothetical protein